MGFVGTLSSVYGRGIGKTLSGGRGNARPSRSKREEKLNDEFSAIKENKNYEVTARSHG